MVYQLFDKRSDSKSLVSLINELNRTNPSLAQQLQTKITKATSSLSKVVSLRHKVFAHRDKSSAPQVWFSAVRLTPKEMKALVVLAQDIICTLAEAPGTKRKEALKGRFSRCEDAVRSDVHNLMQALEKEDG